MNNNYFTKHILCIDLKSFFASCECVERSLDPFTTPLVVANKKQGQGAITLAVTPYLKKLGIKSRGRLYEIPKNIKYYIANPRMNLYIQKSKEVINIYLDFVAEEDLHIYSIDECFLDVTNYLHLYKKNAEQLALEILATIKKKTKLTATCGIGPNLLLAKVAMDIEAKHNSNNVAKWTYEDIPTKLWPIKPLTKFWGIGINLERKLNSLGIFQIGDLAKYDKNKLKDKFGIIGLELWNHANGIDYSKISDFKNIAKDKSYSHSQVLFKDYNLTNIKIIIKEMLEVLTARLRNNHKQCLVLGLGISYSKNINDGFYHTIKLDIATDETNFLYNNCLLLLERYGKNYPIRKVSISCCNLINNIGTQLNLFQEYTSQIQNKKIDLTIDKIKNKYGKNSILKVSNLLEDSTAIERNKKIGGHNA